MVTVEIIWKKIYGFVKNNLLLCLILLAILIGFGIGIGLKSSAWSGTDKALWFTLPGNLFIRSLELLIIPVVFIGVVTATSSLSAKENLHITLICVAFCFVTHVLACLVGLFGSLILIAVSSKSSTGSSSVDPTSPTTLSSIATGSLATATILNIEPQKTTYDIVADLLRNLIPKNIFKATTNQEITKYLLEISKLNDTTVISQYKRRVQYIDGTNILGILVFALLLGLSASINHEKTAAFRELFKALNDIVLNILRWLILLAPVGIASLIIEAILDINDLEESFKNIGLFAGICSASLVFYCIVVLGLMLLVFVRKNPLKYYACFFEPMLLAFASTSGAVCISKCIMVCEQQLKMDQRISKFTVPFYITLHADGSALFITSACIFLANFNNVTFSVGDYVVIIIMTSILCLCLPSVPSASIVTILVVLNSFNLSYLNIAILYTVEWLLDRIRTAVNLYSHCFCAVITYELVRNRKIGVADSAADADVELKTRETNNHDDGGESGMAAAALAVNDEKRNSAATSDEEVEDF